MTHVLIAYDLCVVMIGISALSIAGFWAIKTKEAYLRNFCFLYICFTLILIVSIVQKYSLLNFESYLGGYGFFLTGTNVFLGSAIVIAAINFFHEIYQINARKVLTPVFVFITIISIALILSPLGVTFQKAEIHLKPWALVGLGLHVFAFTYVLLIGYGFIRRVWKSDKRIFVIGLLVFATVGYIETMLSFIDSINKPVVIMETEGVFLFSSIPYALYGIFLITYFLQYVIPVTTPQVFSEDLISRYGITEREQEIILKVVQGKSNAAIAGELFISLATVKTHLNNIYKKMDLDGRFDLISRIRRG